MSRIAPYQWICLRKLKPVPTISHRQNSTTSIEAEISTSHDEAPPAKTSNEELRSSIQQLLHAADDRSLAETRTYIESIVATTDKVENALTTLLSSLSRLQPSDRSIPPYTPSFWHKETGIANLHTHNVRTRATRVLNNINDLQHIAYPTDAAPKKAEDFIGEVKAWTKEEKEKELVQLKWDEESHMNRLKVGIERVRLDVEALDRRASSQRALDQRASSQQVDAERTSYAPMAKAAVEKSKESPVTAGWGGGETAKAPLRTREENVGRPVFGAAARDGSKAPKVRRVLGRDDGKRAGSDGDTESAQKTSGREKNDEGTTFTPAIQTKAKSLADLQRDLEKSIS